MYNKYNLQMINVLRIHQTQISIYVGVYRW